jgi:hypothetical protein
VDDSSAPVPSLPTPLFTGREDILSQLDDYFGLGATYVQKHHIFVLYGLGGGGKTQIVLKFIDNFCHR